MFNEWQVPIVYLHVWIAIIYILVILFHFKKIIGYQRGRPKVKKFNVWFNSMLFFSWVLSGTILYFHQFVPAGLRNISVIIHDWTTWVVIPWVMFHAIGHLFKVKLPWPAWWQSHVEAPEWYKENQIERRDVIKSLGALLLFVFIGGWIKWLMPVLTIPTLEDMKRGYFRIYNVTSKYPRYEESEWSLVIDGLVSKKHSLTMRDLRGMKWETIVDDFHCVTGWSVHAVEMKGVYIKDLFEHFSITAEGKYVKAYSGDKMYFDTYTWEQLYDEGAMLVFQFDGMPLKHSQGFPCRLYHPDMYGYKSVKWLNRLEIANQRELGYWQQSGGYDINGYL